MAGKQSQLDALIGPVVESLGYQLWGIEFKAQGRKQSMLRIYIDAQDKEQGIQLDDCEKVSRQISGVLDVEDPITEEYTLEVSSPGVDRLLFTLEQYVAWAGAEVNVRLRVPFEGRRKYRGVVRGVEDHDVILIVDDHEFLFPIDSIDKAQVIPKVRLTNSVTEDEYWSILSEVQAGSVIMKLLLIKGSGLPGECQGSVGIGMDWFSIGEAEHE